jgi:Uma2 family endonuclease
MSKLIRVEWGRLVKMKSVRLICMTISPLVKISQPVVAKDLSTKKRNPMIEDFNFPDGLPTADELPDSDDTPVDSELQELIPGLLKAILMEMWGSRKDWLFSIDMAFYYDPMQRTKAIAPDGMLSLGLTATDSKKLRSSYVLWQEKVLPLFVVEIVSKTSGGEKTEKFELYQSVGILYYLIYAPLLKRKAKFQLYKLVGGKYVLQSSGQQPYWMPEVGLAIGAEQQVYGYAERELLYWYDENSVRYPTPTEKSVMEASRADAEARKAAEETKRADAEARKAAEETKRADAEARKAAKETKRADAEARKAVKEAKRADAELAARVAVQQENNILRERLRVLGIDPDSIDSPTL